MLRIPTLKALRSTLSRSKGKGLSQRKGGPLADARANVDRVYKQVANFEASCARRELDERHRTLRYVRGFFAAVRHHEKALTGYSEDNVEAHDSLEQATNHLIEAVSAYSTLDPSEFQAQLGVAMLSAVRGLNCAEAFAQYQADLKAVTEDRLGRAAFFKQRSEEGYVDVNGAKHSPAEIASKKERDDAGRADPMARRRSAKGLGRQDTAANDASLRARQDMDIKSARRLRDAIDAAHTERNALPPPSGAKRVMGGYKVRSYLVPQGELNPATWDHNEITRRVAEFRERSGVPKLDRSAYGRHVLEVDGGYQVAPPVAVLRKLKLRGKERTVYNDATRACVFPDKAEADVVYEKFMAPSTSDDERKAFMRRPREAFICAHCGKGWLDRRQSTAVRLVARQNHEKYHCKSRPGAPESSSSEEEESEDESEEEEPEETVEPPPPKRARICEFWSSWGF